MDPALATNPSSVARGPRAPPRVQRAGFAGTTAGHRCGINPTWPGDGPKRGTSPRATFVGRRVLADAGIVDNGAGHGDPALHWWVWHRLRVWEAPAGLHPLSDSLLRQSGHPRDTFLVRPHRMWANGRFSGSGRSEAAPPYIWRGTRLADRAICQRRRSRPAWATGLLRRSGSACRWPDRAGTRGSCRSPGSQPAATRQSDRG